MRSEGTCAARPGPQRSPSPASARTGPRGWSRSAEASEPCSLECLHSPAFASCRLWAGRAWVEAGQEENRGLVKKSPGSPRSVQATRGTLFLGRAQGLARCRCLCPVSGSLSPAGSPHCTHKLEPAIQRIITSAGKDSFLLASSVFNFQSYLTP